MPDRCFSEPDLACWYDVFCAWDRRADLDFYMPRVMAARAVLDVGCGTGMLLRRARDLGHAGRLVGLDPAEAMLAVARTRPDIEWIGGHLSAVAFEREFDLVVMTGHAFQVLLSDDEVQAALTAIARALTDDGCFAFETRNPAARPWERWSEEYAQTATDASGATMRMATHVDAVDGPYVSFTHTYTGGTLAGPEQSHSTLRFLAVPALDAFLTGAGLVVDERYGDWDGNLVDAASPEIITFARPEMLEPNTRSL